MRRALPHAGTDRSAGDGGSGGEQQTARSFTDVTPVSHAPVLAHRRDLSLHHPGRSAAREPASHGGGVDHDALLMSLLKDAE